MNKILTRAALTTVLVTLCAPVFAQKGWRLFPGTEEDFEFKPTISVVGGVLGSNSHVGSASAAYGAEASFMCPLIQNSTNNMRQQVSVVNYSKGNNSLLTVEANLHYRFPLADNLKMGVGPGIGFVRTDAESVKTNMAAVQAGVSLHYTLDKLFFGAEARYQLTTRGDVGTGSANGADNWRTLLKIGYNF